MSATGVRQQIVTDEVEGIADLGRALTGYAPGEKITKTPHARARPEARAGSASPVRVRDQGTAG